MTSFLLNLDQTPDELNELYRNDYYWYFRHPEFAHKFYREIGKVVNPLGGCLDVACGEGALSRYVDDYVGIDGSDEAIKKAKKLHPGKTFHQGRMEDPQDLGRSFNAIAFCNIFEVLVLPDRRVDFVQMYLNKFQAEHFIVMDMLHLDTKSLSQKFHLVSYFESQMVIPSLQEVKLARKVMVYRCRK